MTRGPDFSEPPGKIPTRLLQYHRCTNESCQIEFQLPRYVAMVDYDGNYAVQEYALGKFYVKVFPTGTIIYKLSDYELINGIRIPRAIWLNPTNTAATLDKLGLCVTFS